MKNLIEFDRMIDLIDDFKKIDFCKLYEIERYTVNSVHLSS